MSLWQSTVRVFGVRHHIKGPAGVLTPLLPDTSWLRGARRAASAIAAMSRHMSREAELNL